MDPTSYNLARRAISERPTPPYSAIVCKDGSTVWAEDSDGKTIASGEAGVDDASVIQSAVNSLQSKEVLYISGGEYILNKDITLKDNIVVQGDGMYSTVLKASPDIVISDLGVIGKREGANIIVRDIQVDVNLVDGHGVWFYSKTKNITIERVYVKNCKKIGIHADGMRGETASETYNNKILYCVAEKCGQEAISATHTYYPKIIGCRVIDSEDYTSTWNHNITVEGSVGAEVIGNHIINPAPSAGSTDVIGINIGWCKDSIVVGNYIKWTREADESCRGINMYGDSENCVIQANIIIGAGYGIRSANHETYIPRYNKIIGNIILNSTYFGIFINRAEYHEILANTVKDSGSHGIYVYNNANYAIVKGNRVYSSGGYNIFVRSGNGVIVVNNEIFGGESAGIYMSYSSNCQITGNKIVNPATHGIQIWADENTPVSNVVIERNTVSGVPSGYSGVRISSYTSEIYIRRNKLVGLDSPISGDLSGAIVKFNDGYVTENSGTKTLDGDGTTTDFSIGAHGLAVTDPSKIVVKVTPISSDAIAASPCVGYVDPADNTKIRVKFASAPAAGTGNVKIVWEAQVVG